MKEVKKLAAIVMAAGMLVASSVPAVASASAYASMSLNSTFDVVDGVEYASYSVYGSQSGHTKRQRYWNFTRMTVIFRWRLQQVQVIAMCLARNTVLL